MTKTCTGCGEVKPLDEYHKHKRNKDGRQTQCKTCRRAHNAGYYAENRVARLSYLAEYRDTNRDQVRRQQAEYESRLEVKTQCAEYHAAKPHFGWEYSFRERAEKYGFSNLIPSMQRVTREDLIRIHGDKCKHCHGEWSSLDHWPIPISQGGHHALYNAVPSCMDCQRRTWCAYKPSTETTTTASSIDTTSDRNN